MTARSFPASAARYGSYERVRMSHATPPSITIQ